MKKNIWQKYTQIRLRAPKNLIIITIIISSATYKETRFYCDIHVCSIVYERCEQIPYDLRSSDIILNTFWSHTETHFWVQ